MLHPAPCALTAVAAVLFAVFASRGRTPGGMLAEIGLTVLVGQISIAVINDVRDLPMDRHVHPHRALAAGVLEPHPVGVAAALMGLASVGLAIIWFGWRAGLVVAAGTGAGWAYSLGLKHTALSWAPFVLAFPLLPAWVLTLAHPGINSIWNLWLVGAPAALAVHLADSIPDIEMDVRLGSLGLAARLGPVVARRAALVSLAAAGLVAIVAWAPLHVGLAGLLGGIASVLLVAVAQLRPDGRYVLPAGAIILGCGWVLGLT